MKKILYLFIFTGTALFAQEKQPTPPSVAQPTVTAAPPIDAFPNAPVITFTETTHDFGTVKKGTPVVFKFQFKNTGKESLIIYDCKAGCHCTTPKCPKEPIKPGKTGVVEVHYDSVKVGTFTKTIMVTSNGKNGVVNLVIKGVIVGETEGTDTQSAPPKNNEPKSPVEKAKE